MPGVACSSCGCTPECMIPDVIQALCLLGKYMFACGRMAEASFFASAAATGSVHAGLHRVASLRGSPTGSPTRSSPVALSASGSAFGSEFGLGSASGFGTVSAVTSMEVRDSVALGERVLVFWQAYVLDRVLAVALQRPVVIADDDGFATRIDVPWPEEVDEYESVSFFLISQFSFKLTL